MNLTQSPISSRLLGSPNSNVDSPRSSSPASPGNDNGDKAVENTTEDQTTTADAATHQPEVPVMTEADYERCYQEYYRHYYSHYYVQFASAGTVDETWLVSEAARAAATAASAAVNAMRQSNLVSQSK